MATHPGDADLIQQYIASRSAELREQLVVNYVALVHYVLSRLGISPEIGTEYEDLVNQGLLGLIDAVDRYDPAFETQFSTYATIKVRSKVLDYLRSQDWLSRTARHRVREVQAAFNKLYEKNQVAPTNQELASHLGVGAAAVEQALTDSSRVLLSLDALISTDPDNENDTYESLADCNQPDPAELAAEHDQKRQLVAVLNRLPERERLVLSLYYYDELTLKEIGAIMGVSESRVCQLHARAIMNLKAALSLEEPGAATPRRFERPKGPSLETPASRQIRQPGAGPPTPPSHIRKVTHA
ncbi:MAG: FliA/WhiG family RNA polymerase sigma factor [Anaerolineaceae bacterium]|nr:FliA/WhiG family RNA polymerase sigma factor [Anaerolineaceae bacterium]